MQAGVRTELLTTPHVMAIPHGPWSILAVVVTKHFRADSIVPNSVRLDGRNDERIGLGDEHGAGGDSSHCSLGPATHPQSPAFVEPRSFYIRRGEIRVDFARWVEGNGEYHHVQTIRAGTCSSAPAVRPIV